MKLLFLIAAFLLLPELFHPIDSWGFHPHKLINRHAVFTLPPAMITFYKYHMRYISEQAVAADRRRYAVSQEAPRHYIDLDFYGTQVERQWEQLIRRFPLDSINEHGLLPWHLISLKYQLVKAFQDSDVTRILRLSADAGHYLADAHVPLHTTVNYNGQLTDQKGIHGFWETRVPELLHSEFDLWTGVASYQDNWPQMIWSIVFASHVAVDSVLHYEKQLSKTLPEDRKYSFEVRLNLLVKVFSQEFTRYYHRVLNNQVERRMRAAIQIIGSFWYSCWVDAGQPDLDRLLDRSKPYTTDNQEDDNFIWRHQHLPRK
jgi:hypothetical protein